MSETSVKTLDSSALSELHVRQIGGALGAEISGLTLSGNLDPQTFSELKALLHKHKVIFIRGQTHLNDSEQEKFASLFGNPVPHPTVPSADGTSAILSIDSKRGNRADSWHSDVTFVPNYPKVTVLRGVVVPPVGGDTVWANTTLAYETLPAPLKILADNLHAIHSNSYDYAAAHRVTFTPEAQEYRRIFTATQFETEHPVVRVHPVTGERTLLLGHFVKKLVGFSQRDSRRILEFFQDHITSVDNTVRWQWKVGDVAIWDNQATQHRAVNDFGDEPRLLRRSTVEGEVPVGLDGFVSVVVPVE